MRSRLIPLALVAALAVGGCGSSGGEPGVGASEAAPAGDPWLLVRPGAPTATPSATRRGSPRPGLPPVTFLPTASACAIAWPEDHQVLIPMVVTPGAGSFTVQWPNRYGNRYRLTAVPQDLVTGAQPEPAWQTVRTGAECEVTATIRGLDPRRAYIVWLDAPDTPRGVDGTRGLYSGKTGVLRTK